MAPYIATEHDWPPRVHNVLAYHAKLLRLFDQLIDWNISEPFRTPVDTLVYPDYLSYIAYPIDLSTIKNRLANGFYRRMDPIEFDFKCLAKNAVAYNASGTIIVKNARLIRDIGIKLVR